MPFFDSIKTLVKLCHVLGLAPYSRIANTAEWTKNRLNETVTFVYLFIIASIFTICLMFNGAMVDHTAPSLIIAICIYSLIIICGQTFIVLCETFQKRDQHIKLLNIFEQFDSILLQNHSIQLNGIRVKRNLQRAILFWILETFGLLIFNIIAWLNSRESDELLFFLTYTLPHLISKLSFIYWIILVIILHENVNGLLHYTELVINETDDTKDDRTIIKFFNGEFRGKHAKRNNHNLLEYLKQCYILIWEATILINNIVFWSFPAGFLNEFSVLVFNCYFSIRILQSPKALYVQQVHLASWATMNLINVVFITTMCGKTVEAVILF